MSTRVAVHVDTQALAVSHDDGRHWMVLPADDDGRIMPVELDAEGMALEVSSEWVEASLVVPATGAAVWT